MQEDLVDTEILGQINNSKARKSKSRKNFNDCQITYKVEEYDQMDQLLFYLPLSRLRF